MKQLDLTTTEELPDSRRVPGVYQIEEYLVFFPAVRREVVDGHLDILSFLQPLKSHSEQVKVEGVWVVEVVLGPRSQLVVLLAQHLTTTPRVHTRCSTANSRTFSRGFLGLFSRTFP